MTEKDKKKKKSFDWNIGGTIESDDYEPVEEVHEVGFHRIADGILADPAERKAERRDKLLKPFKGKKGEFFTEESSSGMFHDMTPSEIARLKKLNKDSGQIKGLSRFKKKDKE